MSVHAGPCLNTLESIEEGEGMEWERRDDEVR